jgi:cytochrome c-type biogenesis protein
LPSLQPLARELDAEGLSLLLVDIAEDRDVVAQAVSERGYTAPVVLDTDGRVTAAYRVHATPTVFVLDRDGTLLGQAIGPHPWTEPAGRALLKALLSARSPTSP